MIMKASLVVVDNKIVPQRCELYQGHVCTVVNAHHICPKSWFENAGVLVQTPMITLCPNCHMNTHAAIDAQLKGQSVALIQPRCVKLSVQAFAIATAFQLTPGLTL